MELDFLRKCLGFFAQVLSGQNTTLRFHQKSDLPGSGRGDRAKPPNILILYYVCTLTPSPKSMILRTYPRRSQASNPSYCVLFYSILKRAMNRFEIETSEKLGTPGIEEMSQAWGWKVPTLASTGIKLRPAAAARQQQHI